MSYGYPAVFILSFLSDIIDQPIGPEVVAGFGYVLGLNLLIVFILSVLGSWTISIINFYIGKYFLTHKIRASCSFDQHNNYCRLYQKYGRVELMIAALTPVPYVFSIWLAGAFGMKLRDFFLAGLLARMFRIGFVLWVLAILF